MHISHFRDPQTFLRFHSNIPIDKVIIISLFPFPYILLQFGIALTRFISKKTFMVIVTFFESIFTSTIVIFISSCSNRCFVNKVFSKTLSILRTVCYSVAIASFGSRWCWIFQSLRIMLPNDIVHVRHTTVA